MEEDAVEAFREVNLSDGKCNVSLYVCAEEEKKIDEDPEYASELFKAALEGRLPAACDDSEAGCGSDNAPDEANGQISKEKYFDIEWDTAATWVFINAIKKNKDFLPLTAGNRKQFYKKVQEDLLVAGCDVPVESIRQKFNSLITTYKRIQFKAKRVGRVKTRWEFFEVFDELMKEAEASRPKNANGAMDEMEDIDLVDIKLEPEPNFDGVETLLGDGISGGLHPSPTRSDSSSDMSRLKASPEHLQDEESPIKEESPKEILKNTPPGPASKKIKITANKSPVKKSPDKLTRVSSIKTDSLSNAKRGRPSTSSGVNNGIMKGAEHVVIAGEGFNHAATLLFIDCLKKHKDKLQLKKSAEMFTEIRKEMASEGFSFTEAKLRKKWYNLLISYRRILERANETGDLVSSWPYYEAIDDIIVGAKFLTQGKQNNINGLIYSGEASTSKMSSKGCHLPENSRVPGTPLEDEEKVANSKGKNVKTSSLFDLLRKSDDWSGAGNSEDESDYQRNLLEEWEQRELRREERDILKLEVLKKIAKSIEAMSHKQDVLIELLKKLQ